MAQSSKFVDKKFVGNPVEIGKSKNRYEGFLMQDEKVVLETKGIRDAAVFTNKRLLIIDPQGLRGKKVALITIPLKSISAFSIENSGTLDLEAELKICGSGFGVCELEFTKGTDMKQINNFLNEIVFN